MSGAKKAYNFNKRYYDHMMNALLLHDGSNIAMTVRAKSVDIEISQLNDLADVGIHYAPTHSSYSRVLQTATNVKIFIYAELSDIPCSVEPEVTENSSDSKKTTTRSMSESRQTRRKTEQDAEHKRIGDLAKMLIPHWIASKRIQRLTVELTEGDSGNESILADAVIVTIVSHQVGLANAIPSLLRHLMSLTRCSVCMPVDLASICLACETYVQLIRIHQNQIKFSADAYSELREKVSARGESHPVERYEEDHIGLYECKVRRQAVALKLYV
ncbi:hypothetical protein RB195_016960 [Necator americanus]|uniref:Uncharacterized protein n=1 Tax=Necator americanus TaxID=51031 RepID=A0ABR1C6M9_NECAM